MLGASLGSTLGGSVGGAVQKNYEQGEAIDAQNAATKQMATNQSIQNRMGSIAPQQQYNMSYKCGGKMMSGGLMNSFGNGGPFDKVVSVTKVDPTIMAQRQARLNDFNALVTKEKLAGRAYPYPVNQVRSAILAGNEDQFWNQTSNQIKYNDFTPAYAKANGGPLDADIAKYNKDITYYANGGTHEQNPLGGIPIGNKGLVEQDEFRFGDYIFSNRLKPNKR